jgi:hypothetical protein
LGKLTKAMSDRSLADLTIWMMTSHMYKIYKII